MKNFEELSASIEELSASVRHRIQRYNERQLIVPEDEMLEVLEAEKNLNDPNFRARVEEIQARIARYKQ